MTFPFPSFVPAVVAGALFATWDPLNKNAAITLSSGNLNAATTAVAYESVRATIGKSSSAWYWEFRPGTPTAGPGIMNASEIFSNYVGQTLNSWGWFGAGGWFHNNAQVLTIATYISGDFLNFAFDATNGRLWVGKNGVWQNGGFTPSTSSASGAVATGLTGVWYPAMSNGAAAVQGGLANFGATAFNNAVPAGFNAGVF